MSERRLILGDCLVELAALPDASIDSVVTDPPYGLEFMGKAWDRLDGGFSSPGIGQRATEWPSFGGDKFGGYNPTCATCSGRARGERRCACESPDWRIKGEPLTDGFRRTQNPADVGRDDVFGRTSARAPEFRAGQAMQEWHRLWALEAYRVLKPGGHLLAFGGTRTSHRLACALEDAGFEIRDSIACWMYGSGFPKSLDVSKAIDKSLGAERERVAGSASGGMAALNAGNKEHGYRDDAYYENGNEQLSNDAVTDEAKAWSGFGTALKPAHEPIIVARKPLSGTVAANVLAHGTGGLNIDGCRIAGNVAEERGESWANSGRGASGPWHGTEYAEERTAGERSSSLGRWPANVVLVHHEDCREVGTKTIRGDQRETGDGQRPGGFADVGAENGDGEPNAAVYGPETVEVWECVEGCPVRTLDEQSGAAGSNSLVSGPPALTDFLGGIGGNDHLDTRAAGGASRFFYCAKVSRAERNAGLEGFDVVETSELTGRVEGSAGLAGDPANKGQTGNPRAGSSGAARANTHPTVKPIALMRWLVRLVTPPGGTVLDPFLGSGTTGIAATLDGFAFVGIEREADYMKIAEARIAFWREHGEDGLRIVGEYERAVAARQIIEDAGQMSLLAASPDKPDF